MKRPRTWRLKRAKLQASAVQTLASGVGASLRKNKSDTYNVYKEYSLQETGGNACKYLKTKEKGAERKTPYPVSISFLLGDQLDPERSKPVARDQTSRWFLEGRDDADNRWNNRHHGLRNRNKRGREDRDQRKQRLHDV